MKELKAASSSLRTNPSKAMVAARTGRAAAGHGLGQEGGLWQISNETGWRLEVGDGLRGRKMDELIAQARREGGSKAKTTTTCHGLTKINHT